MTALSLANKTGFLNYFLYKLRNLKSLIILNSVFALLSYPALAVVGMFYVNAYNRYIEASQIVDDYVSWQQYQTWNNIFAMFAIVAAIALIGLFFMGLPILMKNFRYLYDKKYVDMDISLPVSDNTRFLGDFLSGLLAYMLPHIIAIVMGIIGILLCPPIYRGSVLDTYMLADFKIAEITFMSLFLQLSFIGVLSCLLFYCLNLAVVSFCGRGAEARLTMIIINVALPLLTYTLVQLTEVYYYGSETSSNNIDAILTSGAVSLLSPLGMLASTFVSWLMSFFSEGFTVAPLRNCGWLVAIFVCIVYTGVAYFLMKKRRNEMVGSPYMFKGIRHIVSAITALSVFSVSVIFDVLLSYDAHWSTGRVITHIDIDFVNLIPAFVITFIIFIVMELISGKGFKKFGFTLIRYGGCSFGSILLCYLLLNSGGLGAEYYVPNYNDVEAAVVSYSQEGNANGAYRVDNIKEFTELHRAFISDRETNHAKGNIDSCSTGSFGIDYRLKNGEVVSRGYYDVDGAYIDDIARFCFEGNGMANNYLPIRDISDIAYITFTSVYDTENREIEVKIPAKDIFDAMYEDASNMTFDSIYHSSEDSVVAHINVRWKNTVYGSGTQISNDYRGVGRFYENYYIYPCFEKTIKLLSDNGIEIAPYKENYEEFEKAIIVKTESDYFLNAFRVFYSMSYRTEEPGFDNIRVIDINEEIKELIENSGNTVYYGEEGKPAYAVLLAEKYDNTGAWNTGRKMGMVFPEYTEKAEAFWNSLPATDKEVIDEVLNRNQG